VPSSQLIAARVLQREGWAGCGLSPNDIEWDVVQEADRRDWQRAVRALDVSDRHLQAAELEELQPAQIERDR
jgi:hypothetical protein